MALIGFALPAGLNKMLRKNLQKENALSAFQADNKNEKPVMFTGSVSEPAFKKFGFEVK